jgi:hypothetical protein
MVELPPKPAAHNSVSQLLVCLPQFNPKMDINRWLRTSTSAKNVKGLSQAEEPHHKSSQGRSNSYHYQRDDCVALSVSSFRRLPGSEFTSIDMRWIGEVLIIGA